MDERRCVSWDMKIAVNAIPLWCRFGIPYPILRRLKSVPLHAFDPHIIFFTPGHSAHHCFQICTYLRRSLFLGWPVFIIFAFTSWILCSIRWLLVIRFKFYSRTRLALFSTWKCHRLWDLENRFPITYRHPREHLALGLALLELVLQTTSREHQLDVLKYLIAAGHKSSVIATARSSPSGNISKLIPNESSPSSSSSASPSTFNRLAIGNETIQSPEEGCI